MVTDEGVLEVVEFDTVSEKVTAAGPAGAMKVGSAADGLESDTVGPEVWVHAYVSGDPSESELPDPFKVTAAPEATDCAGPALA